MGILGKILGNGEKDDASAEAATEAAAESSLAKRMADKLGYPYKIFPAGTSYEEVMAAYEEAVDRGQKEGFTPVLVPADSVLEEYFDILEDEDSYTVQGALDKAPGSGKAFLDACFREYMGYDDEEVEPGLDEIPGEYDGDPSCVDEYTAFLNFENGECLETLLLQVPTDKPWEVVAYVPFGGWNDCPAVEDMVAVCKYWYEKYGAIPVTISHDVMEMRVPNPISEEESVEVAKEHFAFTPDRVYQCTESGTLKEVSDSLEISKIWYFWWD